jgi:dephospho-CoA kinase
MLRVGLTGGLGSGKTTISAMFAAHGAHILSADEIGRGLMEPGNAVFGEIVRVFGTSIVTNSGSIDRAALARSAFTSGRIEELNRIIHPAVIAEQEHRAQQIFARDTNAVVIVESALIFEASRGENIPGWHERFDKLILVTSPERLKLDRFIARVSAGRTLSPAERTAIEVDGRARMAAQIPDAAKIPLCDYVLENSGPLKKTEEAVARIWTDLKQLSAAEPGS